MQLDPGTDEIAKSFFDGCLTILAKGFHKYDDFLFGLVIGLGIAWLYNELLGNRRLRQSHKTVLKAKDEIIKAQKRIIYEKLEMVKVDKKSKNFFDKIKVCFKTSKNDMAGL